MLQGMANPKLQRTEPHRFGSTLGHYGVGYGLTSSYRSTVASRCVMTVVIWRMVFTRFFPADWPMSVGKWTLEGIETRAQLLDSDGLLRQSSDPYIMVREAYFQRHDFIANGGELKPQENPNAQAIQDDLKDIDSE